MGEAVLMGAALGGGSAMLTGNDPLKGAAIGGAMGGATAGFGGAGVASGAGATAGATMPAHLAQTGAQQAASNAAAGSMFGGMGDTISNTIGQGFDYVNDKTGMENKDWTKMGISQGLNAMQPEQQQQIQAAPMGQGISRPQVDLSQSSGSLLSSNPMTSGAGGMGMTQKDYELLKQGLI